MHLKEFEALYQTNGSFALQFILQDIKFTDCKVLHQMVEAANTIEVELYILTDQYLQQVAMVGRRPFKIDFEVSWPSFYSTSGYTLSSFNAISLQ
jgi:hypothetical protein